MGFTKAATSTVIDNLKNKQQQNVNVHFKDTDPSSRTRQTVQSVIIFEQCFCHWSIYRLHW